MRHRNLSDWLIWQEKLHPKTIDLGLDRIRTILLDCKLDDIKVPIISVAGTNGKGSTTAILASILQAQSYRIATYTSPHLLSYNERICINGVPVEDALLCEAFDFIDKHRNNVSLSFFEFGTLAALYCFQQYEIDCMILEVGLGGRLDAVNVVDPSVAIISSISIDHVQWLGADRESIAKEKAGIMRANTPAICGDLAPPKAIAEKAQACGADLYQVGVDFGFKEQGDVWDFYWGNEWLENLPRPSLFGRIQIVNAATALMALHCLKEQLPVSRQSMCVGLSQVQLSGRFQICTSKPLKIFDIAHNPAGARILAENLSALDCQGRTLAILGVLAVKDVSGILREMAEQVDSWYFAEPKGVGVLAAQKVQEIARANGINEAISIASSVADAYHSALQDAEEQDRILVFGSVLTVAEVLRTSI